MKPVTFFNKKYALIVSLLFVSIVSQSQTVLGFYDFEAGALGWTSGGVDATVSNTTWSYAGAFSYLLRDNSGDASSISSPVFSLSLYDKVDIKFFFSANSMENGEDFFIEYRENSTLPWQTVATYVSGNVASKSADFQSTSSKILYSKTATLFKTNFTFPLSQTAQFRFRCDASDADDQIYVDNITIKGTTYKTPTTAPGGITNNLDLWLKADKLNGITYGVNGANVDKWVDNAKGHNAESVTSSQAPIYRNSTTRNFNFNPVIDFENISSSSSSDMTYLKLGKQELKGTGGFNSNDVFIVIMPDPTITTSMVPLDTFTSTDPIGQTYTEDVTGFGYGSYTARFANERLGYCIGTTNETGGGGAYPGNGFGVADTNSGINYNQISIVNFRHNAANSNMELYFNALNVGNEENDPTKFAQVRNKRFWLGRSQYWDASFDGRIAEVITYSSRKTDANLTQERNRIQSYLAIKYGITLGANGTSQDYVNSDGTTIWDVNTGVPANDVFNYDIAGIGRDDVSELHQKQSRSVNNAVDGTGRTQGVLTMGISSIYDTNSQNTNTLGNKQFLLWGNNGINLNNPSGVININMSTNISPALESWVQFNGIARTWKVVEIGGDIPTVKVVMLKSAIRTATPPNGKYLMFISNTPNFDPTADYRIMSDDVNELGEVVVTTNYDFDGTKYISFGWAPERVYERSISLNGTTNYIDMEDNLNLKTSGFTVSAWIKRDVNSGGRSILSKRATGYTTASGYDFRILADGKFNVRWKNSFGTDQSLTSSVAIPLNIWHNLAVIYNGASATIYIDGVADTAANLTPPAASTHSFLIGAGGKGTIDDFFHGNIDEVRIWNTPLTVDQLRFVMNQEIIQNTGFVRGSFFEGLGIIPTKNDIASVPWNQLAAYYPMTTYTYTNTKDESGNGIQGALRLLRTVDRQTAPMPYASNTNGNWTANATWKNGTLQNIPGAPSIVNPTINIDWNIVQTNHDITIDKDSVLGRQVFTLGLLVNANTLTVDGNMADGGTGNALTVTHYLNLDGKIDLQGESQLIQTLGSDLDPTSSGELDRDQQGTADKFTYNYWSSPVGIKNTTTNNNSFRVLDVMRDGANTINWLTSGYNGTNTTPIGIADYWIWKFANLPDDSYASWQHVRSTGTIDAGEGFTMKGPGTGSIQNNQNYLFTGKPNNGDINLNLNTDNDYLVGNPYPSALDGRQFILDNGPLIAGAGATSGTIYFWEHWGGGSHNLSQYQGGYAQYNLSGGTPSASFGVVAPGIGTGGTPIKVPGRYIPVSQGFFVVAEGEGGTIKFNNGQRVYMKEGSENSVFVRSADGIFPIINYTPDDEDTRMKFRIGFNSVNTIHRQLLLTLDEGATGGIDWGYDGLMYEDQMDDMFWIIDDQKFTIQGTNTIEAATVVPIGLRAQSSGQNSISIDALENVPVSVEIFVHDKILNTYHNLRESVYSFYLPAGENLDRYEITFQDSAVLGVTENELNQLSVYFANDLESIVLLNPKGQKIKSIELFNILGQSVHVIKPTESANHTEYKVKNISTGSYILKMIAEKGTITKKILVH